MDNAEHRLQISNIQTDVGNNLLNMSHDWVIKFDVKVCIQ
jgi:hypothetical protein